MDVDRLLQDLTEPQRDAVTHTDGPLLVLAGAGTGKTRVITRRAAYLSATVTAPWNVLAITFTNKAAGEMRERIASLGVGGHMTVCTFHSLGARLLREFGREADISPSFTIFGESDQKAAMKEAVQLCDLSTENWPPSRVMRPISNAKNDMLTPDEFSEQAMDGFWDTKQIAAIYRAYQDVLDRQNGLDFDDLLIRLARLLSDNERVRKVLQERYTHIQIDEYQDTNRAQYLIARRLSESHENICATGDPDQSIYAWRGADIRNILDFEQDYPKAHVVRLEQNYRSTKRILAAASNLIAANHRRKPKSLWTENAEGAAVRLVARPTAEEEAVAVAEQIRTLAAEGRPMSDFAIFYRTNAMSRVMEDALRRGRVPYQIARGTEFYNRKEIKDTIAYLRVLANPTDEVSLLRIINTPARGIGKVTVDKLKTAALQRGTPLLGMILDDQAGALVGKAAATKIARFAEMMRMLRMTAASGNVREIVEQTLLHSGLQATYEQNPDTDPLDNVNELVTAAAEFDTGENGSGLVEWLHDISLVSDVDAVQAGTGSVTLMTLHAAKGLEFPVVFIIGLEDGCLPHARYREDPLQIEEERRLCFVGMTRAKEALNLSFAAFRMIRGVATRSAPSPFLREMGRELMELDIGEEATPQRGLENSGEFDDWHDGQLVKHAKFGVGRLMWIDPRGKQTRAAVQFTSGQRTLILEYANLELIDEMEYDESA